MFTNKSDIFRTENSFAFTYQRKLLEYNPQNSYYKHHFFLLIIFFFKGKTKSKTENKQQQQYN